jgi:hypothetical protein
MYIIPVILYINAMKTFIHFDCLDANETKIALTLNELQNSGFKTCIFGTGCIGKKGFEFLKKECFANIDYFCDNSPSKWRTEVFGVPVISPKELEKNKSKMVCVVFDQTSHIDIKKQIANMGIVHLIPIDLVKQQKANKDMEYIKTVLLLQNFAPKLLKKMYSGFDIDANTANKAAPFAFPALYQMDNQSIYKILLHLTNGIGVTPETAFNIVQKVSRNQNFKQLAFGPMLRIAFHFPENTKFNQALENLHNELYDNDLNLAYVSFLLSQNKEQQALSILQKNIKKINEDSICAYLPLAEFAYRAKILRGKKIEFTAKVFSTIKNNMKNEIVKKLITNKSIAVVGNGPQELGRKSGMEIDSHDIVVRFNKFKVDKRFSADYGKKTDIYVFSTGSVIPDWEKNFKVFAMAQNPYEIPIRQGLQNSFAQAHLDKLVFIGTKETMAGIYKNYCISGPSSGAKTIYYLKKILKANLRKKDVFGMALSSGRVENGEYHHDRPVIFKDICFDFGYDNIYAEFEMYKHLFRNDN